MADNPRARAIKVSYECATSGARETTNASDLSLGGVFVETSQKAPAVGSLVALEIESGSTKVAVDGRVLSIRAVPEGPAGPAGFAVGFIDLPGDVAASLHFILATIMPRRGTTLGLGDAEEGIPQYVSSRKLPAAPVSAPPGGADAPAGAPAPPPPAAPAFAAPAPAAPAAPAASAPPPAPAFASAPAPAPPPPSVHGFSAPPFSAPAVAPLTAHGSPTASPRLTYAIVAVVVLLVLSGVTVFVLTHVE